MEDKTLLLKDVAETYHNTFFDDNGKLDPIKLMGYMDDEIQRYVGPLAKTIGREQKIEMIEIQFTDLMSVVQMAKQAKTSLLKMSTAEPDLNDLSNVMYYLDWSNIQMNGVSFSDKDYKPITMREKNLHKVFEHINGEAEQILIEDLTFDLFKNIRIEN